MCGSDGSRFDHALTHVSALGRFRPKDEIAVGETYESPGRTVTETDIVLFAGLSGDYNVIPEPRDARYPERWVTDALFQPESRQAFRRLAALGLTDAVRAVSDGADVYTFWDYQAGAWQKNHGIRIDHLMLSPEAADRLSAAGVDRHVRAWEKPSDHVPVWARLAV